MTTRVPTSIQSTRAQTLNGVTYTAGQTLSDPQTLGLRRLSALLSSGRLKAVPDVHARRALTRGTVVTDIAPVILKALTA